jgi:diadenosine tetraphosphate (Ap4A) HIT family hydrolase
VTSALPAVADCVLCSEDGGHKVWADEFARVIVVADADYPGFCRVVLAQHVREMTDLPEQAQSRLMRVVLATESAQRTLLRPDKINLASFGNQVPHLHWHVIPRFADDPHFRNPTFGNRRDGKPRAVPADYADRLAQELARRLAGG